jgi:hypothetical protein
MIDRSMEIWDTPPYQLDTLMSLALCDLWRAECRAWALYLQAQSSISYGTCQRQKAREAKAGGCGRDNVRLQRGVRLREAAKTTLRGLECGLLCHAWNSKVAWRGSPAACRRGDRLCGGCIRGNRSKRAASLHSVVDALCISAIWARLKLAQPLQHRLYCIGYDFLVPDRPATPLFPRFPSLACSHRHLRFRVALKIRHPPQQITLPLRL